MTYTHRGSGTLICFSCVLHANRKKGGGTGVEMACKNAYVIIGIIGHTLKGSNDSSKRLDIFIVKGIPVSIMNAF